MLGVTCRATTQMSQLMQRCSNVQCGFLVLYRWFAEKKLCASSRASIIGDAKFLPTVIHRVQLGLFVLDCHDRHELKALIPANQAPAHSEDPFFCRPAKNCQLLAMPHLEALHLWTALTQFQLLHNRSMDHRATQLDPGRLFQARVLRCHSLKCHSLKYHKVHCHRKISKRYRWK